MRRVAIKWVAISWVMPCLFALCSCGGGGAARPPAVQAPLLVAAGMVALVPDPGAALPPAADLARLGITRVDAVYRATTPADVAFAFDVLTRSEGNSGAVRVSVAHVADGGSAPSGPADTLAAAGCIPQGQGLAARAEWLDAYGDGFSALGMRGAITQDQMLVFEASAGAAPTTVLVCLEIGPMSPINGAAAPLPDYPGVVDEQTLYSSNSWSFGLPAVAVSGDRSSVVVYEGDRSEMHALPRYELRLQHDRSTGAVTGGASTGVGPDSGYWRDHEIAALYNVLCVVRSGTESVGVRLSFDRGATFSQFHDLGSPGSGPLAARLVQIAMAKDYGIAVLYWSSSQLGGAELLLVEGRPSSLDLGGSPTAYAFAAPVVLHQVTADVMPLVMGAAWSDGGDLVVGYGYTAVSVQADGTWRSETQFRCAVRPYGLALRDTLVEEDVIVGRDPSVALLGAGADLQVFYAYEARDGVRLRHSADAGASFSAAETLGSAGAYLPTVFARAGAETTRVDVLYLANSEQGTELHMRHYEAYGSAPGTDHRLTEASMTLVAFPGGENAMGAILPPSENWRLTQVNWFGYDAVLDGDEIVVVYDEVTYEAFGVLLGAPEVMLGLDGAPAATAGFTPADPPVLAPGLTEPLPAPDAAHAHQLRLLRLN